MKFLELRSDGNALRGCVHEPSGEPKSFPIIIAHGYFSANRIGPQRLFVNLSNYLCQKGYYVYRFDFSGMGESDGDISTIKFSNHVKDLQAIIEYVQARHQLNKVIVVAHCLGCNVTLSQVLDSPNCFREVIFLAPFYSNQIILENFFGKQKLEQLSQLKHVYRKGLYADYSFFAENTQTAFINSVNNTPITINAILPEDDQFIPLECNNETFRQAQRANVIRMKNADHNFLETQRKLLDLIWELLEDEKYTA